MREMMLFSGPSKSNLNTYVERILDEADEDGEDSIELKPFIYGILTDRKL